MWSGSETSWLLSLSVAKVRVRGYLMARSGVRPLT